MVQKAKRPTTVSLVFFFLERNTETKPKGFDW